MYKEPKHSIPLLKSSVLLVLSLGLIGLAPVVNGGTSTVVNAEKGAKAEKGNRKKQEVSTEAIPIAATEVPGTSGEIPTEPGGEVRALSPKLKKVSELFEKKDYEGVIKKLKNIRRDLRPSELDLFFFLKGVSLYQLESLPEAKTALLESLSYRATNSDALHLLGSIALKLSNLEDGERLLKEAIWFGAYTYESPQNSWVLLADIYRKTDQPEKLTQALELGSRGKGGEENGAGVEAKLQLAAARIETSDIPGAVKALEGLTSEDPQLQLRRDVLFAQTLILGPKTVLGRKQYGEHAGKLSTELQQEGVSTFEPELVSLAHELVVRLWLAAGDLNQAKQSFEIAKSHMSNSDSLGELTTQLALQG
ncbi:MAG: hypothetical protein KDD70_14370 [Bdellovibrionales bacterium]|nr:hypothetical protein [Bdellovibrionales bacterium]